jgi:hypothetical protein
MASTVFDERVHLGIVGDGFIRTPFLSATLDEPLYRAPKDCPALGPQIVHVPAAGRRSGFNLPDPAFRRAVITSALARLLTTDQAAQANHENGGITFRFHKDAHRTHARAYLGNDTLLFGQRALILDDSGIDIGQAIDFNALTPDQATVGHLAFLNRFWQDLRHVDAGILCQAEIPLQYDCEFTIAYASQLAVYQARIPVIGNVGNVIVWDDRLGRGSYSPSGSPIDGGGTAKITADGLGGFFIDLTVSNPGLQTLPLVIEDDSGRMFGRVITVRDDYPTDPFIFLPQAVVGVPYRASVPAQGAYWTVTGVNLPAGLTYDPSTNLISGITNVYGTNFGLKARITEPDSTEDDVGVVLTVNRYPRKILSIVDWETPDRSTGEFYSCQFMPFGSILAYSGKAWEFRRHRDATQPWPCITEVPYAYGHLGRESARATENRWKLHV